MELLIEGAPKRAYVLYSGIHYDAIVVIGGGKVSRQFSSTDQQVHSMVLKLAADAKQRKMYTNTSTFSLKCDICNVSMKGQDAAISHTRATGHSAFSEG